MAESFRSVIEAVIAALNANFIYRRVGLVYDFFSPAGQMPSPLLATLAEIRAGQPSPAGELSGIYDCALNSALLFDGLVARSEIGFAESDEARISDRLIGGLIRLGTTAPQYMAVLGLTADGKGFYPPVGYAAALYWAGYAYRALSTPVLAMESQAKIRSISENWFNSLVADKFQALRKNQKDSTIEYLIIPALHALAAALTGKTKWKIAAKDLFNFTAKIEPGTSMMTLFNLQFALKSVRQIFFPFKPFYRARPDEKSDDKKARQQEPSPVDDFSQAVYDQIGEKMREIAALALSCFTSAPKRDDQILAKETNFDWRSPRTDADLERIKHEQATVVEPLWAALMILWSPDEKIRGTMVDDLRTLMSTLPIEKLRLARSLSALPLLHALGVDYGVWDEVNSSRVAAVEDNLVARFMSPDYDEQNPQRAGHCEKIIKKNQPSPVAEIAPAAMMNVANPTNATAAKNEPPNHSSNKARRSRFRSRRRK